MKAEATQPTVKPAREIRTVKPAEKPAKAPVDMKLDRKKTYQAKLSHVGLDPAGHKAAQIEYFLPPGHTYENVLTPGYWAPVVELLKRHGDFTGSILHIRTRDHQFFAQLYVTEISVLGIYVQEVVFAKLGVQADEVSSDKFSWIWDDGKAGYDIIRIADGATVASAKEMKRLQSVKDWLEKWDL
jgi:hypothetical protein